MRPNNQMIDASSTTIPTMAVVSARGGMTDLLVQVVDSALVNVQDAETALAKAVDSQIVVLQELLALAASNNNEHDQSNQHNYDAIADPIIASIRNDARDILSIVQSLRLLRTVPPVTMEVVTGFGEIWYVVCLDVLLRMIIGVPA